MNYFLLKRCFYCLLAGVVFASCIKKDALDFSNTSIDIDGTWGIALVNDDIAFEDFMLGDALSITSENDIVKVLYSVPLVTSGNLRDLLPIYDYQWFFSLDDIEEPSSEPYSDVVIFSGEQDILFYGDSNNLLVDSAVFNAGNFNLVLNSTLDHDVKFRLKSHYFHYSNGRILDTLISIPNNVSNFPISIDLTGCRVKLKNNSLPCEIEIIAYNDGHPFAVGTPKNVNVDVYGTLYVFKLIQGKVMALSERIRTESDFSIRSDRVSFSVQNIRDAKIRLKTFNGFGTGVKIKIDTCDVITHGVSAYLLSPANSTFEFEPAIGYYTVREQTFTVPLSDFSLTEDNLFRFGATVVANDPGIKGPNVWVADISSFAVEPSLEMPLNFSLNHLVYRDTIVQEISRIGDFNAMKYLTFRIDMLNDFPIELSTQIYFLDGNYRTIDSLFSNGMLISAARVNAVDGKVITQGKINPNPLFMEVSDSRLEKIYSTKYIVASARATSSNQQTIVRSDHKLKIKLGVKATLKTTLKNSNK